MKIFAYVGDKWTCMQKGKDCVLIAIFIEFNINQGYIWGCP